jgi:hypothetical protein
MIVTGYLTEQKLRPILEEWAGADNVFTQVKLDGTRMRYDYVVERNGRKIAVEFDGDSHFRDANVIQRDRAKDLAWNGLGHKVVRIPYFVQLNTSTFLSLFGEQFEIDTDFPQGFVTTKILPASFCPLGYRRAQEVIKLLDVSVQEEIDRSLADKAKKLPREFVYF